ncbi:MAG: transglutaminase, partial [Lutibacter sp.]
MKKILVAMILVLITNQIIAQDYKFGKVSKEELEEKYYPLDSSANAAVLYKNRRTYFEYVQDEGFNVITEIHERIKIYNKEGFDWATKNITYYYASNVKEKITNLKATTYFFENNKIAKTDLSKKEVFDEQSNKYWSQQKFTMPNLKEGCVLEWTYKIISPIKRIEDLQFQYEIPVKKIEAKIEIPEYFIYKKRYKGYYPIAANTENKGMSITLTNKNREGGDSFSDPTVRTTVTQSKISYITKIESYEIVNVPALIEEAYVSNLDNYKTTVQYEYSELHWPHETIKLYSNTWDNVTKTIYNDYGFKTELNQSSHYSDDLAVVLASSATNSEKITGIFELVKNKIKWNKYNGITKFNGTKKAYKEGVGNVFDINLNLVSMLNKAGFKANPVVLSTRANGISFFPTIDGFNYVIAAVELENNIILLDATEEYSTPNNLPLRVLNWQGRIIREDGTSSTVDLVASEPAKIYNTVSIHIDDKGLVEGLNRTTYSNNHALNYRNSYAAIKDEDIVLKLEAEKGNIEISEFQVPNKKDSYKPVTETYKFSSENSIDIVGNKIYFKPL